MHYLAFWNANNTDTLIGLYGSFEAAEEACRKAHDAWVEAGGPSMKSGDYAGRTRAVGAAIGWQLRAYDYAVSTYCCTSVLTVDPLGHPAANAVITESE